MNSSKVKGEEPMAKGVIVYTTNDCIECTMVKKVLTEEGIPYEVRDISINAGYQQEVEKYGYLGVPVTVLGNTAVKGFTNELKEIIETAKKS
jgi:glutaredoxin-like protein NrdH